MYFAEYSHRVGTILEAYLSGNIFTITWRDSDQAKVHLQHIRIMQKELKFLKKEINATLKDIRSQVSAAKSDVGNPKVTDLFIKKKTAGRIRAQQREVLRRKQNELVTPHQNVIQSLDELVLLLEKCKLQLETSPEQGQFVIQYVGLAMPPSESSLSSLSPSPIAEKLAEAEQREASGKPQKPDVVTIGRALLLIFLVLLLFVVCMVGG